MIGIVGAQDSVERITVVAESMNFTVPIRGRHYESIEEAAGIAEELAATCSLILFSGRAPYLLARASHRLEGVHLDYVSHEGVDLMREVARLLIDSQPMGRTIQLSLDSIPKLDAQEVLADLGMPAESVHTIELAAGPSEPIGTTTQDIAEQHRELYESGVVDVCLTCIDAVSRLLRKAHVPVRRIHHANSVIRVALERCALAVQMERITGGQVAVALLRCDGEEVSAEETGMALSVALGAKVVALSRQHAELVTTRGSVESWLSQVGRRPAAWGEWATKSRFGIGFGETVGLAEVRAENALTLSDQPGNHFIVGADGETFSLDDLGVALQTRVNDSALARVAETTGLSPMSVQRVIHTVQRSNVTSLTAKDLGALHGVSVRTARRLLQSLKDHGYAELVGVEQGVGPGRPQAVYRLHLAELVGED